MLPKVAIVGRANVGKSTLFNRIIGEKLSITDDQPGVTRDRIYAKGTWLGVDFNLIDTGGIELSDAPFLVEIKAQASIAIEEADVIVFVTDCRNGITSEDMAVAKMLYSCKKPVLLAVNKVDDQKFIDMLYEFYALGIGDPIAVSSAHGIGMGDLLDRIVEALPEKKEEEYTEATIKFSLIGRPNVGKSSLVNAILGQERVIVSDVAGTTRDSIDTPFTRDKKDYVVIDTAGIRKRGKIYENAEKYSILRALSAIERSSVVLLVINAEEGIQEQDKHVGGYIKDNWKACVIVVNKWDALDKDEYTMKKWTDLIRESFKYLSFAPICFVSAKDNRRIHTIFPELEKVFENYRRRFSTSILNDVILDAVAMNPPSIFNNGVAKFYYVTQVSIEPPTFVIFVNDENYVHFSYARYLENRIRTVFDFEGTPLRLIFRRRD